MSFIVLLLVNLVITAVMLTMWAIAIVSLIAVCLLYRRELKMEKNSIVTYAEAVSGKYNRSGKLIAEEVMVEDGNGNTQKVTSQRFRRIAKIPDGENLKVSYMVNDDGSLRLKIVDERYVKQPKVPRKKKLMILIVIFGIILSFFVMQFVGPHIAPWFSWLFI